MITVYAHFVNRQQLILKLFFWLTIEFLFDKINVPCYTITIVWSNNNRLWSNGRMNVMTYTESFNTELKREYTPGIIKTIVAFANTSGGKIYIGVEDDGTVIGVEDTDAVQLQLINAVRDTIKPDVTLFITYGVENSNGKKIVVAEVQKGTAAPYYIASKGIRPEGVFVRQGSSTAPATTTAILQMIKDTSGDSYEEAVSVNQELTFAYTIRTFKENELEINESKMKSLGLINSDNVYTNLALLLSEQCIHTIKLAIFQGKDMFVFKNRYEFTGSLLEQLDSAYKILDMYNETQAEFDGLKRIDKRAYPIVAIREALLNSICHRDYSVSASSLISVFSDRIEILSIGGLVSGITEKDIRIGVSALRNKNLANVLYRLKLIEAYGTGIMKIEKSYAGCRIKPEIIISDNAFKIILPNMVNNEISVELSDIETKILNYAEEHKSFSRKELCGTFDLNKSTAVLLLNKLCDKGLVFKIGNGRNTKYSAKNE